MKTAIPSSAKDTQNPASSHQRSLPSPRSGRLAQLAAMMNHSPQVQAQLKLADEVQNGEPVQRQMARALEMNQEQKQGRIKPAIQMKARIPVNDDPGLEHEADVMGARANGLHPMTYHRPSAAEPPRSYGAAQPLLQRKVHNYKDETKKKHMQDLADQLDDCVGTAKGIVDSNPLLTGVQDRTKGYLGAWVGTFGNFVESGEVPEFFYARYGYAIETLATGFFRAQDHKGYTVSAQVTQGSTRPDLVILSGSDHIAWLDITSSASVGHILAKQGGGWKTRPYVAEILYDMPSPADFATTAKGKLSEEQQKKLKEADEARALRELQFDKGMKAMGLLLGNAYQAKRAEKGEGLSKADVREVTIAVCQDNLGGLVDKGITSGLAAGVLAAIESVEVAGQIDSGLSWANWAFKNMLIRRADGRALLSSYGKTL